MGKQNKNINQINKMIAAASRFTVNRLHYPILIPTTYVESKKFHHLKTLETAKLDEFIELIERDLFRLRIKKATRQSFKPHEFKDNKRMIAQLLTVRRERLHRETKPIETDLL